MKWIPALCLFSLFCLPGLSQNGTITVLSLEKNTGIAYASVVIKNKVDTKTSITNEKGIVQYTCAEATDSIDVIVSCIGFITKKRRLLNCASETIYLEKSKINLDQVVVTAEYAPISPEQSIHSIKIITQDQIKAQGAATLRDVLSNELTIRLNQDNVLGSSINMQGVSGQNVKILIDGVPVIGRLNGNIDLSQINLNNVERIEIIEGPLSVNFGTDALAGTINIITKKDQNSNYNTSIDSYYESVGQYNINGRFGWKKDKNSFAISGGRNFFDGWSSQDNFRIHEKPSLADTNRFKEWNPKEQIFIQGQYIRDFKDFKLRIQNNLFNEEIINRGLPRSPYFESAFDDHYNTFRWDKSLSFSGQISKKRNIDITISNNHFRRIKNTYFRNLTSLSEQLSENDGDQDTSKFDIWFSRGSFSTSKDSSKFNCQIGYEILLEKGFGLRIDDREQQIGNYALFMSSEYRPVKDLTLKLGARAGVNTSYKHPLIPSFNFRYRWKKYTFRGTYARGFRSPTIKELYFNFVDVNHNITGNTDLEAESSNNFRLAISRKVLLDKMLFKQEISMFYNDIQNMISLAQANPTLFSYFNVDAFKTKGIQYSSQFTFEDLQFAFGASYVGRYNSIADEFGIRTFNFSPELNSNLSYSIDKFDLSLHAFYKYTGRLPGYFIDELNQVQQSIISDYQTLDLSATKSFSNNKVEWTFGAKNLFNVRNINTSTNTGGVHTSDAASLPISWGRTFFTSIKIDLHYDRIEK